MSRHLQREPRVVMDSARSDSAPCSAWASCSGVGATGTFAFWTDDVTITGTSFTAGTLDLKVNNSDSYATTTFDDGERWSRAAPQPRCSR